MATGDINPVYSTAQTGTGGVNGLASSADWTAGYAFAAVDVGSMTPIPSDIRHSGKIRGGTSPTSGTQIQLYLVPCEDGSNWPDVFTGSANTFTNTSPGVRDGACKLAAILNVDSTTSNRDYYYDFSASQVFGGALPKKYQLFVSHNSGVALGGTAGDHTWQYVPQYDHVSA